MIYFHIQYLVYYLQVQNVVKEIQYLASNYSAVIDVTYYDTEAELEDFFK